MKTDNQLKETVIKWRQMKKFWKDFLEKVGRNGLFSAIRKKNYATLRGTLGTVFISHELVCAFHTIGFSDASGKGFVATCKHFLSDDKHDWVLLPCAISAEKAIGLMLAATQNWPADPKIQEAVLKEA